jgi:hypothetical protein
MSNNPTNPQVQTMIDNIPENTGKSLTEWYKMIEAKKVEKHGDIMKLLKSEHGVTHGYANTISTLYRQKLAGGAPTKNDLLSEQYAGVKAGLRPIYDTIIAVVSEFGSDVEIAPKKTYVSLRRSKQFAIVQAATRNRVDLGFNLKGVDATNRLESGNIFSGMCTHRVRLTTLSEIDTEVISWLRQAYDQA